MILYLMMMMMMMMTMYMIMITTKFWKAKYGLSTDGSGRNSGDPAESFGCGTTVRNVWLPLLVSLELGQRTDAVSYGDCS